LRIGARPVLNSPMIVDSEYRAPWWLRNPHLQTLWQRFARREPLVELRRERLELPDGDFLDLDWARAINGSEPSDRDEHGAARTPVVMVLHGLEGSSASPYAQGMLAAIAARGWRGVVMHFRGCSGELNRLPRSYHSGETGDIAHVLALLRGRYPQAPLAVIGYSLGGNVLLKYLGERGEAAGLDAAAAVSVPFLLHDSADRLDRGFSRFYQKLLVGSLVQKVAQKFARMTSPIPLDGIETSRSFREFDDRVTAPLHGFSDATEYYQRSSSRQYLKGIAVPTLIVQARDDPFMTPAVIPEAGELSPPVRLEVSDGGGHVGFVTGAVPWRPRYWLEERIPAFLAEHFEA
jgi:predicted alpha/beta-fold hydrolase